MKSLITKIVALLALVVILNQFLKFWIPTYWYEPIYFTKAKYYEQNKENYTTLFLGSSRTRSGVNPEIFDKEVNKNLKKKNNLKSFNYAVAAATCGEVFQLAERILNNPPSRLKYIVVELRSSAQSIAAEANDKNLHTDRRVAWLTFKDYYVAMRQLMALETRYWDLKTKLKYAFNYSLSFVENTFHAGMMERVLRSQINSPYSPVQLGMKKNGYRALDFNKNKLKDHKKFMKNADEICKKRKYQSEKVYKAEKMDDFPDNKYYFDRIKRLILKGKVHNIEVLFLIPPLLADIPYYEETRLLASRLPKNNVISMSNAKDFPMFYAKKNIWDGGHFNKDGADFYSKKVAERFIQILESEQE